MVRNGNFEPSATPKCEQRLLDEFPSVWAMRWLAGILNSTQLNHMGTSHFNTSYSIRSCSFLSNFFLLILTGSIASKGIDETYVDHPAACIDHVPN